MLRNSRMMPLRRIRTDDRDDGADAIGQNVRRV